MRTRVSQRRQAKSPAFENRKGWGSLSLWQCKRRKAGPASGVDGSTVTMIYDALDRMIEQTRGAAHTQIVYGPYGMKLGLMNGQTLVNAFVKLPGGASAVYNASGLAFYRHTDHLGSSRLATTTTRTKYYDVAYAPYGEDYNGSGTQDLAFTDQNQDTVKNGWSTNLYDFMFREYRTAHGRWSSPDPAGLGAVTPENPQSWNRYAYVLNNPTGLVDPLGLKWVCHQVWGTGASIDTGSGTPVYTGSQALQICYYVPDVPDSVIVNGSNGGNGQTTSGGAGGGGGASLRQAMTEIDKCNQDFKHTMVGKVLDFGSILSAPKHLKEWTVLPATKWAFLKGLQLGSKLTNGGIEIYSLSSGLTAERIPATLEALAQSGESAAGKAGPWLILAATLGDLYHQQACNAAGIPDLLQTPGATGIQ